jgi:hypothetical protein
VISRRRALGLLVAAAGASANIARAGVEYKHYYIVKQPSWSGDSEVTVKQVDHVLADWGLRREPLQWFDATRAQQRRLVSRPIHGEYPTDLVVRYPGVDSCPKCAQILGPSSYPGTSATDRYMYGIDLIVGRSRRVLPNNEYINVITDPKDIIDVDDGGSRAFFGTVSTTAGKPVRSTIEISGLPVPEGFDGTWQCALVLDCNKDLPAFAEKSNVAPGVAFRLALEKAFGSELIEIGMID